MTQQRSSEIKEYPVALHWRDQGQEYETIYHGFGKDEASAIRDAKKSFKSSHPFLVGTLRAYIPFKLT